MKVLKIILSATLFFIFESCVNQKQKDDEQVKETVRKYWEAVKENNFEKAYQLIYHEDENFYVGTKLGFDFLHRNFDSLNQQLNLLENIKIENPNDGIHQKCVKYVFVKHKPNSLSPVIVRMNLYFFKPIGYNKIMLVELFGNMPEWEKDN